LVDADDWGKVKLIFYVFWLCPLHVQNRSHAAEEADIYRRYKQIQHLKKIGIFLAA